MRAGLVRDHRDYPDTRMNVELEVAPKRALELRAFLEDVPYFRYEKWRARKHGKQRQ